MAENSRLQSFIERVERLNTEIAGLAADRAEVFKQAKEAGFAPKGMRLVIRERAMDKDDLDALNDMLETYRRELGMIADLPLGEAALRKAAGRKGTGAQAA